MDLNAVLDRVKGYSGVLGYVIVNRDSKIVHTSLDDEEALSLGAIVVKMIGDGNEVMREFGEEDVEFLRIRSRKRDIMIVPGVFYSFAILRDTNVPSA